MGDAEISARAALGTAGIIAQHMRPQPSSGPHSSTERGDSGVNDQDERRHRETTRENRRRELAAMTKTALCRMYRDGVTTPHGTVSRWIGGMHPPEQWRKDEVISSILDIEYPPDSAGA